MTPQVSVIIPTIAAKAREGEILRAIRSIVEQAGVDALPILVVNGARFDPDLVASLERDARVRVVRITEGNVSRARHAGVVSNDRPFFGFLDDDDELLPGSIARRLAGFDDAVDVVACNGRYLSPAGVESGIVPHAITARVEADPLGAFMDCNWMSSPSAIFRASSVPASIFDFDFHFFEMTWLTLTLIDRGKIFRFLDFEGFRVHQGTPGSATKTKEYWRANPAFIDRLRSFTAFGDDYDRWCRRKLTRAWNGLSLAERDWGHYHRAWLAHLRCLAAGGYRFLPYTRKLLRPHRA